MAQNPGATAGGSRSKHANGSVLCDKWYRHGKCSRLNCGFAHRDALPGKDIIPPCHDFFTLKDKCARGTNCKLLHNKGSSLVPAKNAPKISGSRSSGYGGSSSQAPDRPVFILPEKPKARENDKAFPIFKSKTVPNQSGRPSGGERGGIASQAPAGPVFRTRDSRRENNRGSHSAQERSTMVKGDSEAGAANAPHPSPKPPIAYSDHVHSIAHSKERNDWRNRKPPLPTHGTRTTPRDAKAEPSQFDDKVNDGKNDGGVSLEIPGLKASVVDTTPPNSHVTKRRADIASNTSNTTRVENKARSIGAGPTPRGNSKYGSSSDSGYSFRNSRALSPATVDHERVMTGDPNHSTEKPQTIGGATELKLPIPNSLEQFLKPPCAESFGCNIEGDELFQISSGGVRLLDNFARQYAPDPDALQAKYGRLCFLLRADPGRDFPQLRYTVEAHRSMFWQLDPIRLRGVDPEMIKPEVDPRDEITGNFVRKTSSGISIPDQDSSEWGSRDVFQNSHRSYNRVAHTTSEYSVSTGRTPPHPTEITPKEHGGSCPSKDRLNHDDRACSILGSPRGAYSGDRYNGQSQVILLDADKMPLGRKGGALSDHSGVTTMVSTRTLTGTDRTVTVESLHLATSKHEGFLSENNATFYPNARTPEHANGEFSVRSKEREISLEPIVKKQLAEDVYAPCEAPGVVGGAAVPLSPEDSAPCIGSGPSSLASPPSNDPAPLGAKHQPTGSSDGEPLAVGKAGDRIQEEVPQSPKKPLVPPSGSQRSCPTSRNEAKMALAVSLQKPGQFAAKGGPDPQRSDLETEDVPSWMNESDSGNETPSVLEWDWDKKSSQTGLTDDEWNVGVSLDRASVESFDGAVESKAESPVLPVERIFELPEDPSTFVNPRDQEARKSRCVKKYRAKESKESSWASEGKSRESPMLTDNASGPQTPRSHLAKQPVPEHKASTSFVPENKARKPPVSHTKVGKPPVPVNRATEPIVSAGVNGKLMASEGHNRNPPRSCNNGNASAPIPRGYPPVDCGGIGGLPEEILHAIFSYAADGVLPEVQVKTKDLTYGSGFEAPSVFNKIRYKGLWSVLRTCRHWRTLGQEILCKYVNLSGWSNLEQFARTVSHDKDMGALVRSLRISVPPFSLRASYQSYNNRDRNSRTSVAEQIDAFHSLPDVLQGCSLIHVMSIDMPNVVPAFNKLVSMQKFPNLREIRMKDRGDKIATGERVWENIIRNTPELKKLVITQDQDLSLRNAAPTVIRIPGDIFHSERASTFKLTQIHLTRSYQISDGILLLLCGKLRNLNDLDIIDCPLVTSRGIAHMLEKLPNQLTRLSFWIWINHYGNASKREQEIGVDLCHALSKYGQSLQHMDIKIFLACHHLWQDGFRELRRCRIAPFHYHDCVKQENIRSSDFFKNVLDEGRIAGKFPALTEWRV